MDSIKFKYTFECINCGTPFTFEHKSEAIESAICPVCKQDRQLPKSIVRIEQVSRDFFDRNPITSAN